jgi:hypothetical protein
LAALAIEADGFLGFLLVTNTGRVQSQQTPSTWNGTEASKTFPPITEYDAVFSMVCAKLSKTSENYFRPEVVRNRFGPLASALVSF